MKKIFYTSVIVLSSIIGVGFLSGKEIYTFFARFSLSGLVFAIVAGVLFSFFIYYILSKSNQIQSVIHNKKSQNLQNIHEKRYQNAQFCNISAIFNVLLKCIYIVISAVMISGFRSLFLNFLPAIFVEILIFALLGVLVFILQKEVRTISSFSVVFMLLFVCVFFIVFFKNVGNLNIVYDRQVNNLYVMCLMFFYVSMNLFTCFTLLVKIGPGLNLKQCKIIGLVCGCVIAILLVCGVLLFTGATKSSDMPIFEILSGWMKIVYIFVAVLGLLTTLFSTLLGAVTLGDAKNSFKNRALSVYFSYILSSLGFGKLISFVYPLIGFFTMLGLIVVFLMLEKTQKV